LSTKIVAIAALLLVPAQAQAEEDRKSGNFFLPYCHRVVDGDLGSPIDAFYSGACVGKVTALNFIVRLGSEHGAGNVCEPANVTIEQKIRVVIVYLEAHPERLHLIFDGLAYEALAFAWPCKK
jgi:hypothetical protein